MRFIGYFLLLVFIVCATQTVKAQQETLFTQYIFNLLTVNPAYTGSQEHLTFSSIMRQHWTGVKGAPQTITLSGHTPLQRTKSSLGGFFTSNRVGPFSTYSLFSTYSYKLPIAKDLVVSLGLQVGVEFTQVDLLSLKIFPQDGQVDTTFATNISSGFTPNVGVGLYLSSKRSFLSLSIPKLYNRVIQQEGTNTSVNTSSLHIYLSGGTKIPLSPLFSLKPNFMIRAVNSAGLVYGGDLSLYMIYKKNYWLGFSHRVLESASAIVNFPILSNLRIGYAYDYVYTISTISSGSHEIFLNYYLFNKQSSFINPRSF